MQSERQYRQRIDRAIGRRGPLLSKTWRRVLWSGAIALPAAILAFGIADHPAIPDSVRFVISPGLALGFRLTSPQPCGGILDCMSTLADRVGQIGEITIAVNTFVFGLLIFGAATTVSALKPKRSDTM